MAATIDQVLTHLGIEPNRQVDMDALQMWTDVANDMVRQWRPDLTVSEPWPDRANGAAALQAARLYGRRGSVQGVAAFADVGVSYMPRLDPDVQPMLELGIYQPSVVA
jgi:hypothetical protein